MNKIISLLFFTVLPGQYALADFFAFRKLVHPQTKNIVYLLYDTHASIIGDSSREDALLTHMDLLVDEMVNGAQIKENFFDAYKRRQESLEKITNQLALLRNNKPNLIKQHTDLAAVVKKHQMSLINEDWSDLEQELILFPLGGDFRSYYVNPILGYQEKHNDHTYRVNVSPMLGMGKTVAGTFTKCKFVSVGDAFYYNPDRRNCLFAKCRYEGGTQEVDANTLQAIDFLFTKYHQTKVVVAEGYNHCMAIAHELVTHQGHIAENLLVSPELATQCTGDLALFLTALENNDSVETERIEENYPELTYTLIASPLDIQALFPAI
jgi:hypothetical protein